MSSKKRVGRREDPCSSRGSCCLVAGGSYNGSFVPPGLTFAESGPAGSSFSPSKSRRIEPDFLEPSIQLRPRLPELDRRQ